jgi:hypothetical protein
MFDQRVHKVTIKREFTPETQRSEDFFIKNYELCALYVSAVGFFLDQWLENFQQ